MPTYHYIFILRARSKLTHHGEIFIDSFHTYSVGDGGDIPTMDLKGLRAAERLAPGRFLPKVEKIGGAIFPMQMRVRFNSDMVGPLHITSDEEISCEELETCIRHMSPEKLKELIRKARV